MRDGRWCSSGSGSSLLLVSLVLLLLVHSFSDAAPDGSARRSGGGGGGGGGDGKVPTTITSLVVPEYVKRGQDAVLRCDWLASGDIYSIKWYFNDREFFAYKPNESPVYSHTSLYGIRVAHNSTMKTVHLEDLQLKSSGNYKCEVISEWPHFLTADASKNLTVVELPEEKPTITGTQHLYRIGDTTNLTCSSPRSYPAADLTWYINDDPAPKEFLVFHGATEYPGGLMESHLGLQFVVSRLHFSDGAMTLRCTARISPLYLKTQQHSVDGELTYNFPPIDSPLSGGCGGDDRRVGWMVMLVVMTVLVVAVTDALLTSAPLR